MELTDLIKRFQDSREHQAKAVFSSLFIASNRLRTVFDNGDSQITLKQFMLLTMVRQSGEHITLTQLGKLLGCSRQNVKKLALSLEKKGFVRISPSPSDVRALAIFPMEKLEEYFQQAAEDHSRKLTALFSGYSDEEMLQLFSLFMRLYEGIGKLETQD